MAPKDAKQPEEQDEVSFPEATAAPVRDKYGDVNENTDSSDWKRRIIDRLNTWLKRSYSLDDPHRLLASFVLTLAAVAFFKLRRNGALKRLLPALMAPFRRPEYHYATGASLSLLRNSAFQGMIQRALVGSSEIFFQDSEGHWKRASLPPGSPSLLSDLLDILARGGCSDVSALPESFWSKIATPTLAALPFIYLGLMYKILRNLNGGEDIISKLHHAQKGRTTFADVAGLPQTIGEVQELVTYLESPELYQTLGAQAPRGILLYGPPGSGKTLLARAVAGEANCDTFCACSGSDFCEMYVGRGAARVRAVFDRARREARRNRYGRNWLPSMWRGSSYGRRRKATAIIFIDELDALAKSRSYGGLSSNDERDQTLNQLLTEMDGFSNESDVAMIVIAASNRAGMFQLCNSCNTVFDRRDLTTFV